MKNQSIIGYPFVNHVDQNKRPTIENPIQWLKEKFNSTILDSNLITYGTYKFMGYEYNLKPYLKLFLVKQYGGWYQVYSINQTTLKKHVRGKIDKIIEIPQE